jgi:hypothetical protein
MLQTRPSSASGIIHTSQTSAHHQYPANPQRNSIHGMTAGMTTSNYRGHAPIAPIAPYAFTKTPNLATPAQRTQSNPHLRAELRSSSTPILPTESANTASRSRYPATASISTTSSTSSSDVSSLGQKPGSKDDLALTGPAHVGSGIARPLSTVLTTTSSQTFNPPTASSPVKQLPDRYRRPNNRRSESSVSGQSLTSQPTTGTSSTTQPLASMSSMPNVMQFYGSSTQPQSLPPVLPMPSYQGFSLQMPQYSQLAGEISIPATRSVDDITHSRHVSQDQAKRYRRRSIHTIDGDFGGMSAGFQQQGARQVSSANGRIDHQQHPLRSSPVVGLRPGSSHGRNGSTESVNSARSSHSRTGSVC